MHATTEQPRSGCVFYSNKAWQKAAVMCTGGAWYMVHILYYAGSHIAGCSWYSATHTIFLCRGPRLQGPRPAASLHVVPHHPPVHLAAVKTSALLRICTIVLRTSSFRTANLFLT